VTYITRSVPDLAAAKKFYTDIMRMETAPLDLLHSEADEALWGLAGAKRDGFLVPAGNGWLEILEYKSPRGKPQGPDRRLSDQGIMNVGLFARDTATIQAVIDRLDAEGNPPDWLTSGQDVLGVYINQPERELELFSCPAHVEPAMGFTPLGKFGGGDFIKMTKRT
jgi:catechol 2,3-dioxygenase-like lactoylglutathione lyase family enzyme